MGPTKRSPDLRARCRPGPFCRALDRFAAITLPADSIPSTADKIADVHIRHGKYSPAPAGCHRRTRSGYGLDLDSCQPNRHNSPETIVVRDKLKNTNAFSLLSPPVNFQLIGDQHAADDIAFHFNLDAIRQQRFRVGGLELSLAGVDLLTVDLEIGKADIIWKSVPAG